MTKLVVFAALFAASAALAEDDEATAEAGESAEKPAEAAGARSGKAAPRASFMTLPLCRQVEGEAFVRLAGSQEWSPAEEGRFYPLGTSYRTDGKGRMTVAFATDSTASIVGDAEFSTRAQPLGVPSRTLILVRGDLELKLADNLPEGAFFVTTPGFVVKNPAGESRFVYEDMGDGDKVTVFCKTGSLCIEGRHFEIPAMRAANTVIIRSSRDLLSTFLYGTSGDYVVRLDQGLRMKDEIGDDGQMKRVDQKGSLDWRLSPATKIVINRAVPAIGERMSVHTMAYDAAGELKSECSFCEGRAEVNSGELVARERTDGGELAKRAAEATETTDAASTEEAKPEEEASENKSENKEEE